MQKNAFFFVLFLFYESSLPAQISPPLIPEPAIVRKKTGFFTLEPSTKIICDSAALPIAQQLQRVVAQQTSFNLEIQSADNQWVEGKKIVVKFHPEIESQNADMLADGYFLKISTDSIVFDAPLRRGHFYALQTFRQMLGFDRHRPAVPIPACDIADAPAFDHRGVMFDVGRHFIPLDFLKKQVEVLAFYKINVVRLHLTEDQAWRIDIKKYPELVRSGAWRRDIDGNIHGGFYTADELRDFVKFCAQLHIEVIPEIEMPGHCRAALAAYPQLSCRGKQLPVPNDWGVFSDVFCVGNEDVFHFLEDVLTEVMAIFPSKIIHIGGDEVPRDRWKHCPKCMQRIENEQLKSIDELQAYFIQRIQNFLESRGRTLAGWDEILDGNINSTAIVQVWRSMDKAREAVRRGHSVVLSPDSHCYLNRSPAELNLETVFNFDPLADSILMAHQAQILGIEATLWSEHITPLNLENMLFPRILAIAEVAWSGGGDDDFEPFLSILKKHEVMLDSMNVAFGSASKNLFQHRLQFLPSTKNWVLRATAAHPDIEFWYLPEYDEMKDFGFDLEKPTLTSTFRFKDSLLISKPLRLKFAPYRLGKPMHQEVFLQIFKNDAMGIVPKIYPAFDERYRADGASSLTDGVLGSADFRAGNWLGWQGQDVTYTFDFQQVIRIKKVKARFLEAAKSWIVLPKLVEFYTSEDGENWSLLWLNEHPASFESETSQVATSVWEAPPNSVARFLKIIAKNAGKLPEHHLGAGGETWIFSDEIIIEN